MSFWNQKFGKGLGQIACGIGSGSKKMASNKSMMNKPKKLLKEPSKGRFAYSKEKEMEENERMEKNLKKLNELHEMRRERDRERFRNDFERIFKGTR